MLTKDETGWLLPIVDLGAMRLCMHHNSVLPYGSMVPTPCALRVPCNGYHKDQGLECQGPSPDIDPSKA